MPPEHGHVAADLPQPFRDAILKHQGDANRLHIDHDRAAFTLFAKAAIMSSRMCGDGANHGMGDAEAVPSSARVRSPWLVVTDARSSPLASCRIASVGTVSGSRRRRSSASVAAAASSASRPIRVQSKACSIASFGTASVLPGEVAPVELSAGEFAEGDDEGQPLDWRQAESDVERHPVPQQEQAIDQIGVPAEFPE